MNIGDIFEIDFYPETCCDEHDDVVHNHFNCPICKVNYASTDCYDFISILDTISCEECGSEFKIISENWAYDCKIKLIKIGKVK